jgi:uncharacterized protein (TIGR00369 family)
MSEEVSLSVRADAGCFACGTHNPIGLHAQFDVDPLAGSACCQLVLDERFAGWHQVIHGGILATLLDEAAIYACRSRGEKFVTANINVRYRRPVPVGSLVEVSAQIAETRRKIFNVHARLEINGSLMAEADVRVMCLDP